MGAFASCSRCCKWVVQVIYGITVKGMDKSRFNINLAMLPVHPWPNPLSLLSSILLLLWSQEFSLTWTVAAMWGGGKGTGQGQCLPQQQRKANRSGQWETRQQSSGQRIWRLLKCWAIPLLSFSKAGPLGCSAVSCLRQMLILSIHKSSL